MDEAEVPVHKLLIELQEADLDENPPPPRAQRGGRVLVQKALVSRVKSARLVVHPNDHPPPHFHVEIAGDVRGGAKYSIETLDRLDGQLPGHLERAIREWARRNQPYFSERWNATRPTDCTATL